MTSEQLAYIASMAGQGDMDYELPGGGMAFGGGEKLAVYLMRMTPMPKGMEDLVDKLEGVGEDLAEQFEDLGDQLSGFEPCTPVATGSSPCSESDCCAGCTIDGEGNSVTGSDCAWRKHNEQYSECFRKDDKIHCGYDSSDDS